MLITLLSAIILIVGTIIFYYSFHYEELGFQLLFWGGLIFFLSIFLIFINALNTESDYQTKLIEYTTLNYKLECLSKDTEENEKLYLEIINFNSSIRTTKYWANNPWTSWFCNQLINKEIDYITIPKKEENQ